MVNLVDGVILGHAGTGGVYDVAEFHIEDDFRFGQDGALAIELVATASADTRVFGEIVFYFEVV